MPLLLRSTAYFDFDRHREYLLVFSRVQSSVDKSLYPSAFQCFSDVKISTAIHCNVVRDVKLASPVPMLPETTYKL